VASGPDKAEAWPALPDGCGSGERVGEVDARNRWVKPPKVSHRRCCIWSARGVLKP
jgi:hypothetical protein